MKIPDPNGIDLRGNNLKNVGGVENVPDGTAVKMYGEDSSGNLVKGEAPSNSSVMRVAKLTLTSADIIGSNSTPYELLPDPPENQVYYIDRFILKLGETHLYTGSGYLKQGNDNINTIQFINDFIREFEQWNTYISSGLKLAGSNYADGGSSDPVDFLVLYAIVDLATGEFVGTESGGGGGGGASAFTELSDVPESYTDQAGKMLIVNENENGLEYIDLGTVITDSHSHANKTLLDSITDEGAGNEFLSDDGTYKAAGLTYFEESRSVAAPNATVPAHQIIAKGEKKNIDVVISPKGTGAILAQVPDGTATGGNKRGYNAVDFQQFRTYNTQVASGNYSATLGGINNKASEIFSTIAGGSTNTASGQGSAITGGSTNTASGQWSSIPGGDTCTASNLCSFANGDHIMASGIASSGLGSHNYATGDYSSIPGGLNAYAKFRGQYAAASGYFALVGDAQRSNYVLRGNVLTTNYYRLYLDNVSALIDLSNAGAYSTWQCKLKVTGLRRLTGAIDHYVSEHNFMIYRENGTPVIADFTEIHVHQVAASSVATGVNISTNSLAIDIATTENNWQFVAHLETVETYSGSLV